MDNNEEWLHDIKDALEEAQREQEESKQGINYAFCDDELLKYSLDGVKSISVYDL